MYTKVRTCQVLSRQFPAVSNVLSRALRPSSRSCSISSIRTFTTTRRSPSSAVNSNATTTPALSGPNLLIVSISSALVSRRIVSRLNRTTNDNSRVTGVARHTVHKRVRFYSTLHRHITLLGKLPIDIFSAIRSGLRFAGNTLTLVSRLRHRN